MKKGIKIWKKRMCGVTTRIRLSPEIEQTTISVACSFNHGREGKPTAATPHRSKAYPPSHPGFWQWGAAVLCFAMLGACSDEIASLPDADVTGKEVEVSLNLDVMGNTDIVTRADVAASEADERKIVNIVPIVFDSNNKLAYMATVLSHDADNKTLTLKMRPSASATDKQRVVLLVNYYKASGTLYGGTDVNTDKGKNYDTWRNSLELKAGTTVVDIPHRGVPMWGESAAFSVKAGSSDQTVQLMRALARIDIGLRFTRGSDGNYTSDVEGVPGYTLSDVAVYYDSSYGTLIPLAANVANHIVTAPTVPAETDVDAAHTYTVTGNKLVRSIYVGEQPAGGFKGDGTNAFTLIAGITNQGIKSYYRINLTKQNDESTLLDILRNHRYVLNIQNITGKGWTTVDDALKSKPANIEWTCDVEDYNQGTYVSGNYYFQIDKWTTVGGNAGNYKSLKFKTNLPSLKVLTFTWDNAASAADATTVFKTPELRDT
ncbi:MAG: hypothetical protein LBL97_05610, partial [Prevotellaceae bacterium]|nr:hypothetical protein [Prevotellaceae bacterium]